MRLLLVLGAIAALSLGCASTSSAPPPQVAAAAPAGDAPLQILPEKPQKPPARSRTFRLGFWEFDLFAVDLEPRGTTVRLFDIRILKLLEAGGGKDYHTFSLVEVPDLFNVFTTRHEGRTHELRLVDLQALAAAFVRDLRESETKAETHLLKLPLLGSFVGLEEDGGTEKQMFLYVLRREVER